MLISYTYKLAIFVPIIIIPNDQSLPERIFKHTTGVYIKVHVSITIYIYIANFSYVLACMSVAINIHTYTYK